MKHLLSILVLASISFIGVNHKAEAAKTVKVKCGLFEFGCITIFDAVKKGDFESVKKYINQGKNINIRGENDRTLLHLAAKNGYSNITGFLIDKGIDPNIRVQGGIAPLHDAALNNQAATVEFLIRKGANVNIQKNDNWTPLHLAAREGHAKTVEALIREGADVNAQMNLGWTPLHLAVWNGRIKTVQYLIGFGGTDVTIKNYENHTPLDLALYKDYKEIANILRFAEEFQK